jgi:ribonuclease kappa
MVKPVVSAMNAWTWYGVASMERSKRKKLTENSIVLSVFAIVILSTIGALFKSGSHTMLGGEEDPEDGNAVAGAVFGAVFIYIVCPRV